MCILATGLLHRDERAADWRRRIVQQQFLGRDGRVYSYNRAHLTAMSLRATGGGELCSSNPWGASSMRAAG